MNETEGRWEAFSLHEPDRSVECLDGESAKATAAQLTSRVFPWRVRKVVKIG